MTKIAFVEGDEVIIVEARDGNSIFITSVTLTEALRLADDLAEKATRLSEQRAVKRLRR